MAAVLGWEQPYKLLQVCRAYAAALDKVKGPGALKVMEDEALQYMPQFKDNARLLFDNFCQSMG